QQRDIHIWGKADPGEPISVALAGQTATARTDESGKWSIHLPALQAGGPFTLSIKGKSEIVIKDVMVGEVWIASGQSNMTFALSGSVGAAEEIPKADYPHLRLFTVPKRVAQQAQDDTLPAAWQICTPETAREFSAVAYYFARDLHRKLNVPIGIIESAWPGTRIEEWMDPEALASASHSSTKLPSSIERVPVSLEFDDFELLPAARH